MPPPNLNPVDEALLDLVGPNNPIVYGLPVTESDPRNLASRSNASPIPAAMTPPIDEALNREDPEENQDSPISFEIFDVDFQSKDRLRLMFYLVVCRLSKTDNAVGKVIRVQLKLEQVDQFASFRFTRDSAWLSHFFFFTCRILQTKTHSE